MKIINIAKSLVAILILILVMHPAWGAEAATEKGPAEAIASKTEMKEVELDGPLSLQITALVGRQLTQTGEELKAELLARTRELEEKLAGQKREYESKLALQKKEFDAKFGEQRREFDASQKAHLENISKVIKQEPPSFTQ